MNPQPLIGVEADQALDRRGESRGVDFDVLFVIAGAHQLDRRIAMKEVALARLVPHGDGRYYDCIRFQSKRRDSRGRTRETPEERHEDSFMRLSVKV